LCALLCAGGVGFGEQGWAQGQTQGQAQGSGAPGFAQPARTAAKASQPPAFSIDVEALGFTAPGSGYLGQNISYASLDFLDENHLLFTFRVPGLIRREEDSDKGSDERHIRALVLALPSGAVEAEAVWTLHDRGRYLWMLKDKHFLLRDGAELKQGDAALELKPGLRFPGTLEWIEMDPSQEFLVAGSREPVAAKGPEASLWASATSAGGKATEEKSQTDLILRILHRDSGQVMLSSRLNAAIHLPINRSGYLESLHARGIEWQLSEHSFGGGVTPVARLLSTCAPGSSFVSQHEFVASVCNTLGDHKLQALTTSGRVLWEVQLSDHEVWPLLVMAQSGTRLAQEALVVAKSITASTPLTTDDLKGQVVHVYDAANGHLALTAEVNPVLDAGGNVAISPSGRRVAVLNGEALEIFELGVPPWVPDTGDFQNGH
jgi:hypothetical protein